MHLAQALGREQAQPAVGTDAAGLALGTYSTEAAAQTALQELGRSGVRSAKVTKEREEQRSVAVRLPALTEAERARVEPLVQQAAGKPLAACP